MFNPLRYIAGLSTVIAFILVQTPLTAMAETEIFVTSGDFCNVRNPGGEAAKKFGRKQAGQMQNISGAPNNEEDFQFTISCPLMIKKFAGSYTVEISVRNGDAQQHEFKCRLEEYTIDDDLVKAVTLTEVVDPDDRFTFIWLGYVMANPSSNRLHAYCALPPASTIGEVEVQSHEDQVF